MVVSISIADWDSLFPPLVISIPKIFTCFCMVMSAFLLTGSLSVSSTARSMLRRFWATCLVEAHIMKSSQYDAIKVFQNDPIVELRP